MLSCSVMSDSATPWTIACQAPLSMGILQARIPEWVTMPCSRGSTQPRDRTQVFCIAEGFFTVWATREAQEYWSGYPNPPPGDLLIPGIELRYPALQADSLPAGPPEKPLTDTTMYKMEKKKQGPIYNTGNCIQRLIITYNGKEFEEIYIYISTYIPIHTHTHTHVCIYFWGRSVVKNLPAKLETQVQSLGQEDPLEKEMATHLSILTWGIPGQRRLEGYSPWGLRSQTWLGD